jgi:hypothetical protein
LAAMDVGVVRGRGTGGGGRAIARGDFSSRLRRRRGRRGWWGNAAAAALEAVWSFLSPLRQAKGRVGRWCGDDECGERLRESVVR